MADGDVGADGEGDPLVAVEHRPVLHVGPRPGDRDAAAFDAEQDEAQIATLHRSSQEGKNTVH